MTKTALEQLDELIGDLEARLNLAPGSTLEAKESSEKNNNKQGKKKEKKPKQQVCTYPTMQYPVYIYIFSVMLNCYITIIHHHWHKDKEKRGGETSSRSTRNLQIGIQSWKNH